MANGAENSGGRISRNECSPDSVIYFAKGSCEQFTELVAVGNSDGVMTSCRVVENILPEIKKPSDEKYGSLDALLEDTLTWVRYEQRENNFVSYAIDLDKSKSGGIERIYLDYTDPSYAACNSPLLDTLVSYIKFDGPIRTDSVRIRTNATLPGWLSIFQDELGTSFEVEGYKVKREKVPYWDNFEVTSEFNQQVEGYKNHFSQQLTLSGGDTPIKIIKNWWEFHKKVGGPVDSYDSYEDIVRGLSLKEEVSIGADTYIRETIESIYNLSTCSYSLNEYEGEGYEEALSDGRKVETGKIKWSKINGLDTTYVIYDKGTNYGVCVAELDSLFDVSLRSTLEEIDTVFQVNRFKLE